MYSRTWNVDSWRGPTNIQMAGSRKDQKELYHWLTLFGVFLISLFLGLWLVGTYGTQLGATNGLNQPQQNWFAFIVAGFIIFVPFSILTWFFFGRKGRRGM